MLATATLLAKRHKNAYDDKSKYGKIAQKLHEHQENVFIKFTPSLCSSVCTNNPTWQKTPTASDLLNAKAGTFKSNSIRNTVGTLNTHYWHTRRAWQSTHQTC